MSHELAEQPLAQPKNALEHFLGQLVTLHSVCLLHIYTGDRHYHFVQQGTAPLVKGNSLRRELHALGDPSSKSVGCSCSGQRRLLWVSIILSKESFGDLLLNARSLCRRQARYFSHFARFFGIVEEFTVSLAIALPMSQKGCRFTNTVIQACIRMIAQIGSLW